MDTLLSHTTALELLRSYALRRRLTRCPRTGEEPPALPPTREDVRSVTQRFPELTLPLHVTLSDKNRRGPKGMVKAHVSELSLPHDATIVIAEGIRCVSPEHLVVQMASSLSLLELVFLLGEMLGTYAICPGNESGMFVRETLLTTKERILAHLDALGPARGAGLVRHAVSLACSGSASPYETKLSMRLGLKPALGGYHLNVLAMNEPIKVARLGSGLGMGVRKPDVLLGSLSTCGNANVTGTRFSVVRTFLARGARAAGAAAGPRGASRRRRRRSPSRGRGRCSLPGHGRRRSPRASPSARSRRRRSTRRASRRARRRPRRRG